MDSHSVSVDVGGTDELTLRVSRCGWHGRTDTECLSMWVPRKNSHCVSLNAGATEGPHCVSLDVGATKRLTLHFSLCECHGRLTLHLFRCGCHGRTTTACLLMWVPRKYSHCVCFDVGAKKGLTVRVFKCGCHGKAHVASLLMVVSGNRS